MAYLIWKYLHVLGVILLIGNVIVTSVWKVFADRTRKPEIIAFAQHLVSVTDWAFTATGAALVALGGYGMTLSSGMSITSSRWLVLSQLLFLLSGIVWLCVLIPLQIRQSRMTVSFLPGTEVPSSYWSWSRRWITWGVTSTIPLVVALYVMIAKP